MRNLYLRAFLAGVFFFVSGLAFAQFPAGEGIVAFDEGRTISLDLKGMDIVEVLKTLASKGEMNLVVGANVRGRVTMFLEDVNVDDAFEIILLANNLASDKRGDIIYVMTQRDYEQLYGEKYGDKKEARIIQLEYAKAPEVSKVLNQIKTKIGKVIMDEGSNTIVIIDAPQAVAQAAELVKKIDKPTTTKIFELNYANVADVQEKIQDLLTKGVGSVQVDERTNKVVVTDLREKMNEIGAVIVAFDDKLQQVLIEAKILEITLSDEFSLGVDWEAVLTDVQRRLEPTIKNPISVQNVFRLATQGTLSPGTELLVGEFNVGDYAAMIQALSVVGDVNTISTPRITVLNNEEAKILIGSNEPYAINTVTQGTSTTTTASELQFLEIGVKLFVTPTINRDGFVTMKIRPEVSSESGTYTYGDPETSVPIVSTTNAETSVMIKDGTTIVIAGLMKDERSNTVNKVPLLGDIPILGLAFKRTEHDVEKKELVIFLTPHIISGESDYLEVPPTYPMGEELFTTNETPSFDKRKPQMVDPYYIRRRKPLKEAANARSYLRDATPEEYFLSIKNMIVENISIPEKDLHLWEEDRVKVSFSLHSGGNLASKPKIIESTSVYLSKAVQEAVEETAPFPVFPVSMKGGIKEFSLEIVYEPNPEEKEEVQWIEEILY